MGSNGGLEGRLTPEARARVEIDAQLTAAGWVVQDYDAINLEARTDGATVAGVAVREFPMKAGHGVADYLLFVDEQAVGVLEAKKAGTSLIGVETQSTKYVHGLPDDLATPQRPLPFAYESTGAETRFTNRFDPVARSREVHRPHRPETLHRWVTQQAAGSPASFRAGVRQMPPLQHDGLRDAQYEAIVNLEDSLAQDRPRALIQMTTGAGKTYAAASETYRLLKHAGAQRVCFLVDRGNLGRQALKEFQTFTTPDTNRKFTELYNVQLLASNTIDPAANVVITTIQRLFSILRGEVELPAEVDESSLEDVAPAELPAVDYNPDVPVEMFDLVIVDECHRSIYGTWRQVLEYFDTHLVGLTATPSKQTLGFFGQNLVSSYTHEQAVSDRVNVDFDVYRITTRIGQDGSVIEADGETMVKFRDRLTAQTRLVALEDDYAYVGKDLDRDVVAEDQLRTVIRTFRDRLFTEIFPGRREVPKTLVFAKDDAHADRIVQTLRAEFDKPGEFAVKITYKTTGRKPEELLAEFRTSYNPRIAVTVDMIATGTDIKPLECVFFLRGVKSRNFFEQMKGRGVRVINDTDFQQVTPDASAKTHFVIVDAVGVTETALNETTPLDREPTISLHRLMHDVSLGKATADLASTLGSRLTRLDRILTDADRTEIETVAGGRGLAELAAALVSAVDPDRALAVAQDAHLAAGGDGDPSVEQVQGARTELVKAALWPLKTNPELRAKLVSVKANAEQLIDEVSPDQLLEAGFTRDGADRARQTVDDFRAFLEESKDELTALQALYAVPYKRRVSLKELKELANALQKPPRAWTADVLWDAYATVEVSRVYGSGRRIATDLVSLVRFALEQDNELVPYRESVAQKFQAWVSGQEQHGRTFTGAQMEWLERIRDTIAGSLTVSVDDFDYSPFVEHGGLGGAYAVFGDQLNTLIDELNDALVA